MDPTLFILICFIWTSQMKLAIKSGIMLEWIALTTTWFCEVFHQENFEPTSYKEQLMEMDHQVLCFILKHRFYVSIFRSSHPEVLLGKDVLKICSKFIGEHPCQSAISIILRSTFIEIALRLGCSPVNLLHIFRTPFPKNIFEGILCKNGF